MNKQYKALRKAKRISKRQVHEGQYVPLFKDPRKFDEIIGIARLVQKTDDEPLVFDMDDSVNNERTEEHYVGQKVLYMGNPCYITIVYPKGISISGKINGEHKTISLMKPYPSTLIDSNKASKYILPEIDPMLIWKWLWDKQHHSYFIKFSDYEENKVNLMNRTEREQFFLENPHFLHEFKKPIEKKSVRLNPSTMYFVTERWKVEVLPEPFLGELYPGSRVIVIPPNYDVSKIEDIFLAEVSSVDKEFVNLVLKKTLFGKELKKKKDKVLISDKKRLFLTSKVSHKTVYPISYYDWLAHRKYKIKELTTNQKLKENETDGWEKEDVEL